MRSENGCNMRKFSSINHSTARELWICWRWFIWDFL